MALPGFNAEASLYKSGGYHTSGTTSMAVGGSTTVIPQICIGTPCIRLPSGRFCFNLPIFGRRCVTIPSLGSWNLRCCTRFGFPPVSCGLNRCG